MVKVVLRSTVAAVALMVGFSHIVAAAPITSNWTPGNAGNWSGGPGGDAVNWSHSSAPATTTFPNNTGGDTFTVNIDNGGGPASSVNLNVNATIDTLNVSSGDTLNINNNSILRFAPNATVTNNGSINANSGNNPTGLIFTGASSLTGSGTVTLGNNAANLLRNNAAADVLTHGATHTIQGAGNILHGIGGLDNAGTILANQGAPLTIDPGALPVNNTGTLGAAAGGTLLLASGVFNNAGGSIEADGPGSNVSLSVSTVTVNGGSFTTTNGGQIRSFVNGPQLNGVTFTNGTDVVLANNHDLRILNGLTNNGTISMNSGNNLTDVQFTGSQTLAGTGEIVMGPNLANRVIVQANANTITQSASHTIRGAGRILQNAGGFINQGSVVADDASRQLLIDAGTNFRNEGTMRAEAVPGFGIAGGTRFTQAGGLFDIDSGSRAQIHSGDFVQTGGHTQVDGLLNVNAINSDVQIQGGTFGGTGLVDFDGTGVHALNNTGGMITAGASPGTLTIQDGSFVQGAGGTFEFELDGFVAGVGHDLLNVVNGDADLVNGADLFDNIIINLGGLNFTQLFIGNSLFIEVTQANMQPPGVDPIPEPESIILMMLGLTALLWMRRRRVTIH